MNNLIAHALFPPLEIKIQSHPGQLADTRRAVEAYAQNNGFDNVACGEIGLVINEALANVMRHAYRGAADRPIIVRAEVANNALRISIRDWGNGVNPQELPPKNHDPLTPGGIGMICLRQLMDEVVFTRQPDGMLLSMTRRKNRP
jgi:serine/threonine-protein kinase RsbW